MKNYSILFFLYFINPIAFSQIAIGKLDPDPHAQLDISVVEKENKGILIPRISLSDIHLSNPFDDTTQPIPESLLLYNAGSTITPGYYYWYDRKWNRMTTQTDIDNVFMKGKNITSNHLDITGGDGATLKDLELAIKTSIITEGMLQNHAVTPIKINPGAANQVLTTNATGNGVTWTDPSEIGTTTNELLSGEGDNENNIKSTVNGVEASTTIVKSVVYSLANPNATGYPFSMAVNGVTNPTITIPEPWNLAGSNIKATLNDQNIYQSGRVGIGEPNMVPLALLDVRDDVLINHIVVGRGKGNTNFSRTTNTVVGTEALNSNTTGNNNTGTGYHTLRNNTTGNHNTGIGRQTLTNNTEGNENTAVGSTTLRDNISGSSNTAIGFFALSANTTGNNNTAIGYYALDFNETGSNNTAIGFQSGSNRDDLSNTIAIGYNATVTASNTIRLGNNDIKDIFAATSITTTSDRRWKDNIKTIPLGLEFINKVRPVEYIRKNNENKTKEWGVIAQELQQTIKDAGYEDTGVVQGDNTTDNYLSVRYTDLIAPMIKAIQELSQENNLLKVKNNLMETKINELAKKILNDIN